MKIGTLFSIPLIVGIGSICACSAEVGAPQTTATTSEGTTACPALWPNSPEEKSSATIAYALMKLAAQEAQSSGNLLAARSILAPQRYIYLSGTTCYSWGCTSPGIQFDPTDPLYSHVTNAMKAELAFGQLDASVGSYLANGLFRGMAFTDGQLYPSIFAIPALAQFTVGKTMTAHLDDSTSQDNSHYATLSSATWCGTTAVTIAETVNKSWAYAPIAFNNVSDWRGVPAGYVGVTGGTAVGQTIANAHEPTTPFNGPDGQNDYLLVSINGVPQHWAYEAFPATNCWNNPYPTFTCNSQMEIDPVPYAEPVNYYDSNNNLVGPQPNPFAAVSTSLYADPAHAGQWASRTVNGTQEWGQFSNAVTLYGTTKYQYVKRY